MRPTIPPAPTDWTGCITTDPAAMVLPIDDHMVHRGHGVFDTAHLQGEGSLRVPFFFSRTQHSQTIGQSTRRVSTVSSTCTCLLG